MAASSTAYLTLFKMFQVCLYEDITILFWLKIKVHSHLIQMYAPKPFEKREKKDTADQEKGHINENTQIRIFEYRAHNPLSRLQAYVLPFL